MAPVDVCLFYSGLLVVHVNVVVTAVTLTPITSVDHVDFVFK